MKNLAILIVIILAVAGAFYIMKPHLNPMESEYLDFKLGSKASPEMKATDESDKFKTKSEIYYSIFSKKPFENDTTVEVVIRNMANLAVPAFNEKLGTVDKKVMRPINPVNSETAGKFAIEIVKDGAVIARKLYMIGDDIVAPTPAPAPAATQAAPAAVETPAPAASTTEVSAPAAEVTGEIKVEAPAAPVTGEVKAEAPVVPEAPAVPAAPVTEATGEVKTN